MNGTFLSAITLFSPREQERILKNIDRWQNTAEGAHFSKNIKLESHLFDLQVWRELLSIFLKSKRNYVRDFLKMSKRPNWFKGKEIVKKPMRVGRIMTKFVFYSLMSEVYHLSEQEVDEMTFDVNHKKHRDKECYRHIQIARNVTFVTWNEEDNTGHPFDYARQFPNNKGLRSKVLFHNLGLKHTNINLVQRVMVYDLDPSISLKIPTVIDAGNYQYFFPAAEGADHGYTNPYFDDESKKAGINKKFVKRRPEGIHDSLGLSETNIFFEDWH